MKKIISLSALLLAVILLAGCAKVPEVINTNQPAVAVNQNVVQLSTDDWQTYTNEKYGFSIDYPADWEGSYSENYSSEGASFYRMSKMRISPDKEGTFDAYLVLNVLENPNGQSLQDVLQDRADASYQKCMETPNDYGCPKWTVDSSKYKEISLAGKVAFRSGKIDTDNPGPPYDVVYVVMPKYFISISGEHYNKTYDFEPIFEKIILSFKFLNS